MRVPVCRAAALRPGKMTWVLHGGVDILVANVEGAFYAMDNMCSHSGGSLADGTLRQHIVRCPFHGWEFDVRTGCAVMIKDECLPTFTVVEDEGQLFVEVPDP